MNSRFKPITEAGNSGETKKSYCDQQFKKHLTNALIINKGEPDNIEKIRGNRYLKKYPAKKIIEYVNSVSADVQKHVELSIEDPNTKKTMQLANLVKDLCDNEKPQELPLVLKLKAESELTPVSFDTNHVNFAALNQFLYSAASGLPDYVNLNNESLKVLYNTHQMLTEQVEHDATPEFLSELESKICAGYTEEPHTGVKKLAKIFQDKGINPFNFPFEYLLNGALPEEPITDPLCNSADQELPAVKPRAKKRPAKN